MQLWANKTWSPGRDSWLSTAPLQQSSHRSCVWWQGPGVCMCNGLLNREGGGVSFGVVFVFSLSKVFKNWLNPRVRTGHFILACLNALCFTPPPCGEHVRGADVGCWHRNAWQVSSEGGGAAGSEVGSDAWWERHVSMRGSKRYSNSASSSHQPLAAPCFLQREGRHVLLLHLRLVPVTESSARQECSGAGW